MIFLIFPGPQVMGAGRTAKDLLTAEIQIALRLVHQHNFGWRWHSSMHMDAASLSGTVIQPSFPWPGLQRDSHATVLVLQPHVDACIAVKIARVAVQS